jgi:hypothetical protein
MIAFEAIIDQVLIKLFPNDESFKYAVLLMLKNKKFMYIFLIGKDPGTNSKAESSPLQPKEK